MLRTHEFDELEKMETLDERVHQLLKVEEPGFRVWLCLVNHQAEYEVQVGGTWYDLVPTADGNWLINT